MIRVVQIGLGPIGLAVTRQLLERQDLEIVGAVDVDPTKVGKDLGELAGSPRLDLIVRENLSLVTGEADVAVITTTSSLRRAASTLLDAVDRGLNIVSTCEELAYPWGTEASLAEEIDRAALSKQVTILGTGINPGFLMDYLPAAITGLCHQVSSIKVERLQDASLRRLPFQEKIGAGLSPPEFLRRVEERTLRHVGLTESMYMIASRIGWKLERTEDIVEPVLATETVTTEELEILSGQALGVNQTGRAFREGKEVITLVFRATIGEPEPYDRVLVEGLPSIDLRIDGGVNGDIGTVAVTINALKTVLEAPPGLKNMLEVPAVTCSTGCL